MRTILVVDDDQEMRSLLCAIFARHQYEVLTAETLAGAAAVMQTGRIDLVVCDVILSDGNAFAFHKQLSSPPPFLFLSGYSEQFIEYTPNERTSFAMKPVNPAFLITKAADLIANEL